MRNKMDYMFIAAKNKAASVLKGKDNGIEGIVVAALLCVIAVALTATFRTMAGNMITDVGTTLETSSATLVKEFVPTT